MAERVHVGIDVGTSSIKIVVAERVNSERDQETELQPLHVLGAIDCPMEGVQKGSVTNVDDAVASVTAALEKAERLIGVPLSHAVLSIGSPQMSVQPSRGVVAVSKVDGEVKEEDVDRVIDAAQTITTPPNYEILHVLPRWFTVDGTQCVDPVGMTGTRLEVDAQIVYAPTAQVRNITKVLYRTGSEIDDIVFGILATAEVMLDKRQRDVGVVLINIGFHTTSLAVFEEGNVVHATVLGIGSNHITGDIAIGLRTSLDVAERVKCGYASARPDQVGKRDETPWAEVGETTVPGAFSRHTVSEIVEARVEEIFTMVDQELKKSGRSGLLPGGAILTGAGSLMDGMVDVAKRVLKLPVTLSTELPMRIDGCEDLAIPLFSQALGLVVWSAQDSDRKNASMGKGLKQWTHQLGQWISSASKRVRSLFPWGSNRAMLSATSPSISQVH